MNNITLCSLVLASCIFFFVNPAQAFTADSLDITISQNGDAIATFRFTLEGILENSIPQSTLETELMKGLTTSTEPPELRSMDRSSAVLFLRQFADTSDVPTGTEYRTASMDFTKAEAALKSSALSSVISADFSPATVTLTFPDSYQRQFTDVMVLHSVTHTVVDPSKVSGTMTTTVTTVLPAVASEARGSLNVVSSPLNVRVLLDSRYIGDAPSLFPGIEPGNHTIGFSKEGYESTMTTVTIPAGKTINVTVVLNPIPPAAPEDMSSFAGSFWPVAVLVLTAIAICGYYFWHQKKKKDKTDSDEGYVKE